MCTFSLNAKNEREILSMNKGWSFHLGDIEQPVIKGHGNSYRNAKAGGASGTASLGYDDSEWRILDLPHDWAIEGRVDSTANLSQGYYNRGIGWYRRRFKVSEEDKGKHFELQFDGISTYTTIWVNGTILHRNWCGYTSMYIDVTPYITYGDNINTIAVRVDADAQEGWWYEGAGIYRHTWLVKRAPLHIKTDGIFANPVKEGNKWVIPAEVTLYNSGEEETEANLLLKIISPDGKIVANDRQKVSVKALRENTAKFTFYINNPLLWSPDSPHLYKVIASVEQNGETIDETSTKCGFRTLRFDSETGFWLNDENIKIKGVCCHQDHAGVGVAMPDALILFRLKKLKEMGVNAYRAAHNPTSKEFMEACDSMGIMVMDENRIFNTSPEYVRQLEWLVRRDRNHPSVILWSVFNEEPMQGSENGYEMVRRMYDVVKKLDSTRPITAAMNGGLFTPLNVSDAVDVVGFNYQTGNYNKFHNEHPDIPLISSEDGSAFMIRGEYTSNKKKNIIDEYDSQHASWGASHRRAWKEVATRPWMAGCFYWTGFDYHGEPTPFSWPSVSSFFGIMDLCGFPKMAYHLHQALWLKDKDVLEIVPHWNFPQDSIGKPIKVMTLTNLDKVALYLNGKKISEQDVNKYDMNTWSVPYKPGKLKAVGYRNGKKVMEKTVETTKEGKNIKLTPDRSYIYGNGYDAIPITVEVTDSKGRHVPTANNMIEFEISGPARIIGLGNGNPNSHEPEKGNNRSLFNGLAQVIIQNTGEDGEVVLKAKSEGLTTSSITIETKKGSWFKHVPYAEPQISFSRWSVSPVFESKPNINISTAQNDMNSWQPAYGNYTTKLKEGRYLIMKSGFKPFKRHKKEGGKIIFRNISGEAEIWLDNILIGTKNNPEAKEFEIEFPQIQKDNCELKILFKAQGNEDTIGINGGVLII